MLLEASEATVFNPVATPCATATVTVALAVGVISNVYKLAPIALKELVTIVPPVSVISLWVKPLTSESNKTDAFNGDLEVVAPSTKLLLPSVIAITGFGA